VGGRRNLLRQYWCVLCIGSQAAGQLITGWFRAEGDTLQLEPGGGERRHPRNLYGIISIPGPVLLLIAFCILLGQS